MKKTSSHSEMVPKGKKLRCSIALSFAAILAVMISTAQAQVTAINAAFNTGGDTVGSAPATSAATVPLLSPTSEAGTVVVAQNYTPGTATLSGRSAVLDSGSFGSAGSMAFNNGSFTTQDYSINFNFLYNPSSNNGTVMSLELYNPQFGTYLGEQASVTFAASGTLQISDAFGTKATSPTSSWSADTVMNLRFDLLYSASDTANVYVNNALVATATFQPETGAGAGVQTAYFYSPLPTLSNYQVAITDIDAVRGVVPEPATTSLILAGLGVAGALCVRKSKKS